jgi:hypothetical protein
VVVIHRGVISVLSPVINCPGRLFTGLNPQKLRIGNPGEKSAKRIERKGEEKTDRREWPVCDTGGYLPMQKLEKIRPSRSSS